MANLDTAFKRASGVSPGLPWRTPGNYPPSGGTSDVEREAAASLYGGIAPITGTTVTISIVQPYITVYFWKRIS